MVIQKINQGVNPDPFAPGFLTLGCGTSWRLRPVFREATRELLGDPKESKRLRVPSTPDASNLKMSSPKSVKFEKSNNYLTMQDGSC